ncbi:receptor kinase-like protein Xa21 isoform X2 [Coffea eugenioides]|uniref:receptor kinase-like protein Xa21 isoform X2 n=1 Tax=Coffea eugenioides TaxID=49369 RepID=UPI000F613BCE|nr:receptor kinase-like protein Xa21 isoform X2 [Coffea eugenioides]
MLDLGSNNLAGHVQPGVFNMSSLIRMSLVENNFNGSLPLSMWTTLPNIQWLNLRTNKFTGTISSFISNASKLTLLSLTENSFTGPIPNTLGDLRFLKRLFVGINNFTRESSTPELRFITSLTNCRDLETMELSLNQFNGFLPTSIGNLSKTLTSFNAFGSKIKGTIPGEIGNISSLESINMDSNEFTGSIPSTIGKLTRLDRIYLEHNRLQGSIPAEICQLKMLGDLYLNENLLSGPIPYCLGEITSLRRVFLHLNNLTSTIPLSFWNLNDLLSLNLSSNSLSGDIPSQIQNLKVIIELDLSWNQLSGDILSSFSAAQSLVFLSLAHNTFRGRIPQSMGNLISLEYLDLSHNDFSGTIPQSLVKLGALNYFNVSFNRLEGEVPTGGPFANFTAQSFSQNFALCGLARLDLPPRKTKSPSHSGSRNILKYILPPIVFAILMVAVVTFLLVRKRRSTEISSEIKLFQQWYWRRVSYEEILEATDSFSSNNLLGTGSFGSVFKGTLLDGSKVAVKVFHLQFMDLTMSFDAECEVLASIRHRNLIKILSCCGHRDFRALVLEYLPNGSLEKWLHSENYFLDVVQRFKIIVDVAFALEYLHHDHAPDVVHCDLKPSNILLDEDMVAHVCDFSISKSFGNGETMIQTNTLATIGYMAPGKKPTDDIFGEELNLKQWVSKSIEANSVMKVVDRNLIKKDQNFYLMEQCLLSILRVGLLCLSDLPHERINMRNIVARLENIEIPPVK